jgi:hypothetical protein
MAQYPVNANNKQGIASAVNTLLSGPSGLGQNFAGFSSYTPMYLTGNFRVPFTQTANENLYVPPISLGACEMLDGRTWKYYFLTTQSSTPFSLGNGVTVSGVANDYYDNSYTTTGVIECTTTYFVVRTSATYAVIAPSSGGTVEFDIMGNLNSTDANARVTTTGATDRVFIGAQLDQLINYTTTGLDNLTVTVQVNRYVGFLNQDPTNPDYLFDFDETVSQKIYSYTGLTGSGTIPLIETVFATIVDQPTPNYYWYILEVEFDSSNGLLYVTDDQLLLRDLSAQVVKQ